MVDLPEAERPVSQRVRPLWLRRWERWGWVRVGDQVRLFGGFVGGGGGGLGVEVGSVVGGVVVDMLGCEREGRDWGGGG